LTGPEAYPELFLEFLLSRSLNAVFVDTLLVSAFVTGHKYLARNCWCQHRKHVNIRQECPAELQELRRKSMARKFEELRAKMRPKCRVQNSTATAAKLLDLAPHDLDNRPAGEAPTVDLLKEDADEFAANRESIDDINRRELA
jgi:hypothetical protein